MFGINYISKNSGLNKSSLFFHKTFIGFLFIILFISSPFISDGQAASFSIKGVIIDAEDSSKLPYVNIQIEDSFIGTNTTEAGDFVLHLPDTLKNDTLVFSSVGYKTERRAVKALASKEDFLFQMSKSSILMDEVSVLANANDSIFKILKKVRKKFNRNYPTRKHVMDGFIRKITSDINGKDSTYTALVEAAFRAQAKSYRQLKDIRCDIIQYRKSYNNLEVDYKASLMIKALTKAAEIAFGYEERNELFGAYRYALIQIRKWSDKDFLDGYDINIMSTWEDEGDKFMKLRFQEVLSSDSFPYFEGYLTINLSDYAIVEFYKQQVEHPTKPIPHTQTNYLNGAFYQSIHVLFRSYDGTYFPRFINYETPSYQLYDSRKSGKVYDQITIMFSNAEYTIFNKIKRSESLEKDKYLGELDFEYDADFWENYNAIPETPVSKKITEQLEREVSLEEQYKN
ncbi:MAG: carboxypeptidase-like regulatory domain-containing protein [Bacteroidota bacterium]